jgi:hypothetical protein
MREVDDNLVRRAGLVVVDSSKACEIEAGELISAGLRQSGMVELGAVLRDGVEGSLVRDSIRDSGGDIVMFKSVSHVRKARLQAELDNVGWIRHSGCCHCGYRIERGSSLGLGDCDTRL